MTTTHQPLPTERAFRTMLVYQQYAGIEDMDTDTAIQRLVSELRLLAEEYGCDWDEILAATDSSGRA